MFSKATTTLGLLATAGQAQAQPGGAPGADPTAGMDPAMMEQLMASMGKGGGGGKGAGGGGMPGMEEMMASMGKGGGGGMGGMDGMPGMEEMMAQKGKGKGKKGPTCDPFTLEDCSKKEKKYIKKIITGKGTTTALTDDKMKAEFERLKSILTVEGVEKNVGEKQGKWMAERASILARMLEKKGMLDSASESEGDADADSGDDKGEKEEDAEEL